MIYLRRSTTLLSPFPLIRSYASASTVAAAAADKLWGILQRNTNNGGNIEKTLASVGASVDSASLNMVLDRFSTDQSRLGLRFFIWAGLQSRYRHSSYVYDRVCKLFQINRNPRVIREILEAYRAEGCSVSVRAFKVVLNLCRKANLAEEGLWVLREMEKFSCRPDTVAFNAVIRLFCEKPDMDTAGGLMKEMGLVGIYPNMITYVAMINGFCIADRLDDAWRLFGLMKEDGCYPNAVPYSALLDGICRFGSVERGLELLGEMEKLGGECAPTVVSYTSVMQQFCQRGRSMDALIILEYMQARGLDPNRVTVSILVSGLCEEGCVEEAYKLIHKVVAGGSVSSGECFSFLVVSLLRIKGLEEAERLFRKMLATGIMPDSLACSLMLRELCLVGRVLDGFILYDEIEKIGFPFTIDSDIYSILLVGLCKRSHLVEATKVARIMLEKVVQLKAPYVEDLVEHLKNSKDEKLLMLMNRAGML